MISVSSGQNLIVLSPDEEFPLGEVDERDEIIREYAGSRLVGVRLIKAGDARG